MPVRRPGSSGRRKFEVVSTSLVFGVFSALLLSACNQDTSLDHEGRLLFKNNEGVTATVSKQIPPDLPAYANVYPGATVTSSMALGYRGGILTYEVAKPPEAIMQFYKSAASRANLNDITDSWHLGKDRSGTHLVVFNGPATGRSLTVSVRPGQGATKVAISYGAP
jgi:hypothetical protein